MSIRLQLTAACDAKPGDDTVSTSIPIPDYSGAGVWVRCRACEGIHYATTEGSS